MAKRERLPDEAFVVRCGVPPFEKSPLDKACDLHPDGVFGFSVLSAAAMSVERLATACKNATIGFLSVGEIREMGYDIQSTGPPHHATVIVPQGWDSGAASKLARLFRPAKNPSPRSRGRS